MSPAAALKDGELGLAEFRSVAGIMHDEARISLSPAKVSLVQSRLARRLRARGLQSFRDYVRLVREDDDERAAMVTALTTNHTSFFREKHHFDHLRETLRPMLKDKVRRGDGTRIWSAGCSSGEEVYSIAMTLLGTDESDAHWLRGADVRLLATDISPPMVAATERATYPRVSADSVPLGHRALWLREEGESVAMVEQVRALVTARVLNLFSDWPIRQRYDAIFCRNVMIYFDDESKAELEIRLVDRLLPGGFLYIGHSERLVGPAAAIAEPCGQTIYVKREEAA